MDIFSLFKQIEQKESSGAGVPVTHMIVGLGNPGDKYRLTRHNAGFLSLDYISQKKNAKIDRVKFKALVGECMSGGKRTLLMLPQTFMNNSGEAVAEAASFYKIPLENITVIYDDISLDVGRLRIRKKGSDGGHNGIKSIISHLGSDAFPRIKVGVGAKPYADMDLADWVLSKFTDAEQKTLFTEFDKVLSASELISSGKIADAMNLYNGSLS